MAGPSDRLLRRIHRDFTADEAEQVITRLAEIPESLPLGAHRNAERFQASIVLAAQGDYREFLNQLELAHLDWRDVLVNAGLAESDWPKQLEEILGRNPPNFFDNRWLAWRTRRSMHRGARAAVRDLKPRGVIRAIPFLGFYVNPVVWLVTQRDDERDSLAQEPHTRELVIACLLAAGVRPDLAAQARVTIESEQTVDRDFGGDWRVAMQ